MELDEVVLNPYNLSGNLSSDIQNINLKNKVSSFSLELPNAHVNIKTQTERRLHEADGQPYIELSLGFVANLNPILNAINGKTKTLKNRLKIEQIKKKNTTLKNSFENDFFTKELNIPIDKIEDFILFCSLDDTFIPVTDTKNTLHLIHFLQEKSTKYLELNYLEKN